MNIPPLTRESKRFKLYCANLAAFMWSGAKYHFETDEEVWDALPDETKNKLEDFILDEKKGPVIPPLEES